MGKYRTTYIPVIFALLGLAFGLFFFFVYALLPSTVKILFEIVTIFLLTLIGFQLGVIIKNLDKLSYTDPLTGISNKRHFYKVLTYEINRLKINFSPLTVIIIDVDNFKQINDTYGHLEGDRILKDLAKIFKNYIRASDTVSIWGGDEYAIILPSTDTKEAKMIADTIMSAIKVQISLPNFTVSMGISCARNNDTDAYTLLCLADQALYKAKEQKDKIAVN